MGTSFKFKKFLDSSGIVHKGKKLYDILEDTKEIIYPELENGENYAPYWNTFYYRSGDLVTVHIGIHLTEKTTTKIFTLDKKYWPKYMICAIGHGGSMTGQFSNCAINQLGEVSVNTQNGYVQADIIFYAADTNWSNYKSPK